MLTRIPRERVGVWVGVGVLALAGCGQESKPVAEVPVQPPPVAVATPTPPPVEPAKPEPAKPEAAKPPTDPAKPVTPGGFAYNPIPMIPVATPPGAPTPPVQPGTFTPPTSPTFTPPESLVGQGPAVQPPAAQPPAAQPPAVQPPAVQPPAEPAKPQVVKYPEKVGGKDLKGWLKQLEYTAGGPLERDDNLREMAVKSIPLFGPAAREPSVKPLINAISVDPDPGVQIAAITVVSSMGFDMREQVKPVIRVLQNKLGTTSSGNLVRMYCVRSLASFGPDAATAIPFLKNASRDPSWETRREVAVALSLIGAPPMDFSDKDKPKPKMKDGHPMGPDKDAINILLDNQLQDPSVAVRLEAAKSLLTLGPPSAKSPVEFFKETEKLREAIDKAVTFEGSKSTKISTRGATPDRGVYVWVALMQLMYDERKIPDNLKILAGLVAEPDGPNADQVRLFALQALGFTAQVLETLDKTDKPLKEKVVKAVSGALAYEHEPALQLTALYSLALIGKEAGVALPDVQRVAAKAPKPPAADAPKGTPPDDTLQRAARHTAEVIRGLRKMEDYGKEDPKPGDKK